jgi:hypothetical protein
LEEEEEDEDDDLQPLLIPKDGRESRRPRRTD